MGHLAEDCEGKGKRKSGEFDEPYQVSFNLNVLNIVAGVNLFHNVRTG